ncbi:hypothetical protein NSQ51_15865 [Geobacillus sp. FSL K6-0789]|uniref:Lipoprotein n=1 Tax=Geobacillus stearothermophilus TaxID=1422 RepID=A0A3L7D777_GEOSE|nr:hypothetical protein [Geobacillus stearothermophilus]RLQ07039.1 hypothetical protein D9549_11300 [Geobacillus stearothermophilus]RLQ08450.1 hypothetical protein D9547_10810 [Geobacillus stearothermophilus]RLQ13484.1 hypothetical protein D9548_11245 [Geobacillus stearothermophilus]
MKKKALLFKLFSAIVALFLASGCNGDKDNPPPPNNNQNDVNDLDVNPADDINQNDDVDNDKDNDGIPDNRDADLNDNQNNQLPPGDDTNNGPGDDEHDTVPDREDPIEDPQDANDKDNKDE